MKFSLSQTPDGRNKEEEQEKRGGERGGEVHTRHGGEDVLYSSFSFSSLSSSSSSSSNFLSLFTAVLRKMSRVICRKEGLFSVTRGSCSKGSRSEEDYMN